MFSVPEVNVNLDLWRRIRDTNVHHASHPAELQRPMNFEFLSVIAKQLIKKAAISSFGDHHRHPFQVLLKQNHSNLF